MSSHDGIGDIERTISIITGFEPPDEKTNRKKSYALAALNGFREHFNEYASVCTTLMEKYFPNFVRQQTIGNIDTYLDELIYFLILLITEYVGRSNKVSPWMARLYRYYHSERAYKDFPIERSILIDCNNYINTNELSTKFDNAVNTLDTWSNERKQQFERDLDSKTAEVNALTTRVEVLKATLEKLHTEYNFVGLSHAFKKMLLSKRIEKYINIFFLFLFGIILLLVPAYEIYSTMPSLHPNLTAASGEAPKDLAHYMIKFAPFVLLEALFIYFFRIVLQQFYSVKGQIAQLQLRNALCMFIEKHAEFKEGKDEKLFEKFDALIFSPIVTKEDKIPSTLDGLEQLSKLLQPIKSKKE